MAMDLFNLVAKITLDKSEFEGGISKLDSSLSSAMKVGAAAIGAATAAVGAFGASSVKTGMEFDKSMSQVAATLGKTMDEMENETGSVNTAFGEFNGTLREFAQYMGANTAFSASEAANALNFMALAGYDAQTSMNMLPNVLNLAAAGNMELSRASDMVTDTQTAFGISLERTAQLVDEMAKAASTGNTSVEQLGDAFLVVGGLAQDLNGGMVTLDDGTEVAVDGVQELEIALTGMANAGIKGSEAGTHMRNMLLKLSDPTDEGATALENLGVKVFDTEGKMRSLKDIFSDMSDTFRGDVTPSVTAFYEKWKDVSDENLLKMWNKHPEQLEIFGTSIVDQEGKLRDFNDVLAETNERFAEGLSQEEKIKAISDIFNVRDVASAEALLSAVEQDWDAIGESILDAEGAAQKMADTQLDNLAGDITKMKSAFEGVQIAVSDGLTPVLRKLVQGGTEGLSQLTTKLKDYLQKDETQARLQKIADAAEKLINLILDNLDKIFDLGITVITGIMDAIGFLIDNIDKIVPILSAIVAAWGVIKAANIITAISGLIPVITTVIGAVSGIVPVIMSLINPVTLVVAAVAAAAIAIIANWDKVKAAWGVAVQFFKNVWSGITSVFKNVGSWISDRFSSAYKSVTNIWGNVTKFFGNVWSGVQNAFKGAYENITKTWSNLGERFASIRDTVIRIFQSLPENFLTMGKNIISGLYNGIVQRFNDLIDGFKNIGSSVIDIFNSIFRNASPSKEFKKIGGFLMEGLAIGIEDKAGLVEDTMRNMADLVYDNAPDMGVLRAQAEPFTPSMIENGSGRGQYFAVPRQKENKQLTVILELDRMVFGRAVYNLNNEETQRVGVKLAGGYA